MAEGGLRREGGADKDCLVPPSMLSATAVVGGDLSRCACFFANGLGFAGLPVFISVCTRVGEVSVLSQRVFFLNSSVGNEDGGTHRKSTIRMGLLGAYKFWMDMSLEFTAAPHTLNAGPVLLLVGAGIL